ncbi:hypothetical protein GGH91_001389 [Coemansia sp. RSA 2671]|nr:hypothetical protein LPJ60_001975 [Coemansia sp. RSA 2675]KAJ2348420.1 hypothetical protein GGH91_001389 [Coemansia sp. RSA 2671]
MKMYILSLLTIAVAPASLAAVISSAQQEEYQTIGFLNNFVAPLAHLQSASPQCQGDCLGSEAAAASAEEPQQSASVNQISKLIREFVQPFQQPVAPANFAAALGTPALDMVYNYLNTPTFASPAASSPTPSLVNRLEAKELSEVAVPAGWWFAPASESVATSSVPYYPFAAAFTAAPQVDEEGEVEEVESVQSASGFDYSSWGQRMDNAAIKLARNVEGIIFEFVPKAATTVQAPYDIEYDDAPESATTTAPASWF